MRCPRLCIVIRLTLILFFSSSFESYLLAQTEQPPSLKLLINQYQDSHAKFSKEMNSLADFCVEQGFLTDAERIRNRTEPVEKNLFNLDELPEEVLPNIPVTLDGVDRQWRVKLQQLETDFANELYLMSRRAMTLYHASFAFRLIREVAFHNPDHEFARKLLGFVRDGNMWTTPFAKKQKLQKYVDHPQFGWILEKNVARYEQGQRLFNGRWISSEKEKTIRTNFKYAWVIQTENFEVTTNHSLEKGVEIGRALEVFHRFFLREYAAFFDSPQQMQRLFETGGSIRRSKQYRVYYYQSKEEFVSALKPREARVAEINGLYMPIDQVAYFFHPEEDETNFETMFHEVTHQLLSESSAQTINNLGEFANFWLVEGFASYMESFKISITGSTSVGDPEHIRMYWAKRHVVEDNFYVPLKKFTSMGKNEFQRTPTTVLSKYYSQGSGLAFFLLHYEGGVYRDEFIKHMSLVYSPNSRVRDNPPTLEELTGVSFEILDQQYIEFIKSLSPAQ